ncbi:MAG: hypothetical protein LBC85_10300 [Fibromonadaceae bacterium]|jgi:hypothetical protein|nr:hypothetical protein [Fibromonadaceae bacterium]
MVKLFPIILVLLLFCQDIWAQRAREDDRAARRQWEEDQRADEYATSLRRRDWLKDRLILELGMGSKFPAMGANWVGFGAGVEYITQWHVSGFLTAGFIPAQEDPVFNDKNELTHYSLEGGMGWRLGVAYYMFPKSPIHLGLQLSYGTVFFDHEAEPDNPETGVRAILPCRGFEFGLSITYLTDQWYFLQAMVGMYYIGNGLKDNPNYSGGILVNDSWRKDERTEKIVSRVTENAKNPDYAIPPYGIVFGIGIGFAFPEFFPDDTEIRRREREDRSKQNVRPGSGASRPAARPAQQQRPTQQRPARPAQPVEEYDDF